MFQDKIRSPGRLSFHFTIFFRLQILRKLSKIEFSQVFFHTILYFILLLGRLWNFRYRKKVSVTALKTRFFRCFVNACVLPLVLTLDILQSHFSRPQLSIFFILGVIQENNKLKWVMFLRYTPRTAVYQYVFSAQANVEPRSRIFSANNCWVLRAFRWRIQLRIFILLKEQFR